MLREHLTQDHNLASRKANTIEAQASWIHTQAMNSAPGQILDLGCGPGLYAPHLADRGHCYQGIDFSPASIAYANEHHARAGKVAFKLGDVTRVEYGEPYALAMMLYGEINVFSPENVNTILKKAFASLLPGGRILLEAHTYDAVRESGKGQSWYAVPEGLFREGPHLCLTQHHWFEEQNISRQDFHVLDIHNNNPLDHAVYHSTMQAWTKTDYVRLLSDLGFVNIAFHEDWPNASEQLLLIMAMK